MSEPTLAAAAHPRAAAGAPRRACALRSVATLLPETVVTNDEIARRIGKTDDWIYTRTGIRERRYARPDERLSDFATEAGRAALAQAGIDPATVDLVLVATMTQDELTPNTAPLVAHALGAERAGAIDIGAACTSFLSAVALAAGQIESGRVDTALVIGADFVSRITDHDSKATAMLFADGAGAVVMTPAGEDDDAPGHVWPILLRADGSEPEILHATHEERLLQMDGHATFKHAVARMTEVTRDAVAAAGLTLDEIDLFAYHQANGRIVRAVGERLGLDGAKVIDCIEKTGNMSAATIPFALEAAQRDGRLRPGARVLMSAFGAGFTWGGGVIEWGGSL